MEQLEGKRGPQQRSVVKPARAAKDTVGGEQEERADSFAAPPGELGHVEIERLEQFAVGVAFHVLLEKPGEKVLEQRRCLLQLGAERGVGRFHALGRDLINMRRG